MDKHLTEEAVKKDIVYQGKFIELHSDQVILPNGRSTSREYLEHPGSVAIIPVLDDDRLILVKQFRYPINEVLLEIPAGKMDPGETPETSARRELVEETGFHPGELIHLLSFWTSPGFCNEKLHLYLARKLEPCLTNKDKDEFVEVVVCSKSELDEILKSNELIDGKTALALHILKSKNLW